MKEINLEIDIPKTTIKNKIANESMTISPSEISEKENKIIKLMRKRISTIYEVKGVPKEIDIPITTEELILEINYIYELESELLTEQDLNEWIDNQNNRHIKYYYKKYLIAWKILTNDIKVFSPINSKLNINIKPTIEFDKNIPEELKNKIQYEDEDYKDE